MIASLPMYWRDENAPVWQAFWEVFRAQACTAPDLLEPQALPEDWAEHWLDPNLFLSMTCGLPFRTGLRGRVTYVGTLGFSGQIHPGYYRSVVILHPDADLAAPLRLAFNSADSQSGWAASQEKVGVRDQLSYASFVETGSHASSLKAVADAKADIAFIDENSWTILQQFVPEASEIKVLGKTTPTPGLPLITAIDHDPMPLRRALTSAVKEFAPVETHLIGGPLSFHVLTEGEYFDVPIPKPPLT